MFAEKGFFQELLRVAVNNKFIALKEGVEIRDLMLRYIAEQCEEWITEHKFDENINEYREIYFRNHLYLVDLYLSEKINPEEALELLIKTPAHKVHEEAVKYYEKRINDIYLTLKEFEPEVVELEDMHEIYNEAMKSVIEAYKFDEEAKFMSDITWDTEYITMNSRDLDMDNIVKYFENFVNGFILEIRLRSKLEEMTVKNHYEIQNKRLSNILLELAYMLLRLKRPRLSENKKHRDKCLLLLKIPPEEFYEMLFGHEEIIKFSEEEKDYLRKYLLYMLESEAVVEHMK